MAVRFDASGDYLSSGSSLLDYNGNYTAMGWVYISTDTNADSTLFNLFSDTSNYDYIGLDVDGVTLDTYVVVGGANTQSTGTTLSTGTWYHVAAVRSSTTLLTVYLNGVSDQTNARDVTSRSAIAAYRIGQWDNSFPLRFDGRVHSLKFWDTNLSAADVLTEMDSISPKTNLANLNRFSPIMSGATERLQDYSDNRANWTANGTLTDEDPPPVSWGTGSNIEPFAAASSDLNVSATKDTLTLTDYNASINSERNLTTTLDALTLTDYNTSVNAETGITTTLDTLTLTSYNVTINAETSITTTLDTLPLSSNNVTINAETGITTTLDALTLTSYNATINSEKNVSAAVDTLALTNYNPSINAETSITTTLDALTLTEHSPAINAETGVLVGVDALTLTPYNATITTGSDVNISAAVDVLTLTDYNASINSALNISASSDTLSLTAYNAVITTSSFQPVWAKNVNTPIGFM